MSQKKSRLSEDSKQLLAHILEKGPQNLFQLCHVTGEMEGDLVKRLRNLRIGGWLELVDDGPQLCWGICKDAIPLFKQGLATQKARKDAPKPMGEMAKPRQINVMGGYYKTTPFTPPRKGSMDFKAIDSLGVRC